VNAAVAPFTDDQPKLNQHRKLQRQSLQASSDNSRNFVNGLATGTRNLLVRSLKRGAATKNTWSLTDPWSRCLQKETRHEESHPVRFVVIGRLRVAGIGQLLL